MDLVFSDIHADIEALETILKITSSNGFTKKYDTFDRIINLGDLMERGNSPKQVLLKLESLKNNYPIISVMGNHDEAFLYQRSVSGSSLESLAAHHELKQDHVPFFEQNRDKTFGQQQFIDEKNSIMFVHGGPLDPQKIIPKDEPEDNAWLYQRSWQRISEEEFEFFDYSGYHYKPISAFDETKKILTNFVILCGHQHEEAALLENKQIHNIYHNLIPTKEKISDFSLEKREIEIEKSNNYIIRLGLGGPSGYYGVGMAKPHFGIIQYNPRIVTLFTVR